MTKWDTAYHARDDEDMLLRLGYKQQLLRNLGFLHSFSISFSVISISTGMTMLFGYGLAMGGPATMVAGWVIVSFFSMFIGLSMAEIVSAAPASGGPYFWSARLAPPEHSAFASWITAWFNLLGQVAVSSGLAYGLSNIICNLARVFAGIIVTRTIGVSIDAAIILSWVIINAYGRKILRHILYIAAAFNSLGVIALAIALLAKAPTHQSASFVFGTFIDDTAASGDNPGWSIRASPAYVACCGALFTQYTVLGYDASSHLIEETKKASWYAPMAIISSLIVSLFLGFFMLLALLFSIQDFDLTLASEYQLPILQILVDVFGVKSALALFALPLFCIWCCGLFCMTSISRLVYAFSRDKGIPQYFSIVSDRFMCPVRAVWLSAILAFCLGLPALGSLVAFTAITSLSCVGVLISYGIPIAVSLRFSNRFRDIKGPFNLGWASQPTRVITVLWISFITIILCLPTTTPVTIETFNYSAVAVAVLFICATIGWIFARNHFEGPIKLKFVFIDNGNLLKS